MICKKIFKEFIFVLREAVYDIFPQYQGRTWLELFSNDSEFFNVEIGQKNLELSSTGQPIKNNPKSPFQYDSTEEYGDAFIDYDNNLRINIDLNGVVEGFASVRIGTSFYQDNPDLAADCEFCVAGIV